MEYYDKKNNRLVFTGKAASSGYWDQQWDAENFKKTVKNGIKNRLIVRSILKYIEPKKSKKIMEAGCGNGQFVYAFNKLGYDSYGIDYAVKTIARIKNAFPDLKVNVGNVEKIDFSNNYFDGYWSIGVIEHFFKGYGLVIREIERILKPGGFLFITFPYLSPLRKLKIKLGFYPNFSNEIMKGKEFYQFALDENEFVKEMTKRGFFLLKKTPYSGTKGLKDEVSFLKPLLQKIYDSRNIFLRIINYGLSVSLSLFSGHSILLVFRKK